MKCRHNTATLPGIKIVIVSIVKRTRKKKRGWRNRLVNDSDTAIVISFCRGLIRPGDCGDVSLDWQTMVPRESWGYYRAERSADYVTVIVTKKAGPGRILARKGDRSDEHPWINSVNPGRASVTSCRGQGGRRRKQRGDEKVYLPRPAMRCSAWSREARTANSWTASRPSSEVGEDDYTHTRTSTHERQTTGDDGQERRRAPTTSRASDGGASEAKAPKRLDQMNGGIC